MTTLHFFYTIPLIVFVINIFFCWTLYMAMNKIPAAKQIMPDWCCWLILIPVIGFIFAWILLPFVIPKSLASVVADKPEAIARTNSLSGLGFTQMIFLTVSIIPIIGIFTAIVAVIIWIIYWVKINSFRKLYLENLHPN